MVQRTILSDRVLMEKVSLQQTKVYEMRVTNILRSLKSWVLKTDGFKKSIGFFPLSLSVSF